MTPDHFDTVRPLLNNIAMEFGHDSLCRTNSGFPDIRDKGCNCSRAEAQAALAALAEIEERLREETRIHIAESARANAEKNRADRAEAERDASIRHAATIIDRAEKVEAERDELEKRLASACDEYEKDLAAAEAERDAAEAALNRGVEEAVGKLSRVHVRALEQRVAELEAALEDAVDVAIWLTGACDLTDAPAWPSMREKLDRAQRALERE